MRQHNPDVIAGPFATYSHGIEIVEPKRLLFGAGQVGVRPDGTVGEDVSEQARLVWENIAAVLDSAGMEISDIVQLNMLLLDRADRDAAHNVRQKYLGEHRPASTLMYVSGLSRPEWRVEIDFIAAR
ncbi:MAG TPA: RidA family protein [Acidimicrobiia bacterium]|nr:RidA family protein [Acidimicrobiia bacterium]